MKHACHPVDAADLYILYILYIDYFFAQPCPVGMLAKRSGVVKMHDGAVPGTGPAAVIHGQLRSWTITQVHPPRV